MLNLMSHTCKIHQCMAKLLHQIKSSNGACTCTRSAFLGGTCLESEYMYDVYTLCEGNDTEIHGVCVCIYLKQKTSEISVSIITSW